MAKRISYTEPSDYFPESVRKKAKIGEFAETGNKATKKKPAKKTAKKK